MKLTLSINTPHHRWVWDISRTLFLLMAAVEIGFMIALPLMWLFAPTSWLL